MISAASFATIEGRLIDQGNLNSMFVSVEATNLHLAVFVLNFVLKHYSALRSFIQKLVPRHRVRPIRQTSGRSMTRACWKRPKSTSMLFLFNQSFRNKKSNRKRSVEIVRPIVGHVRSRSCMNVDKDF